MNDKRKRTAGILGGIAVLLTLFALTAYFAFLIVQAKPVQERIAALVSEQFGDNLKFANVKLTLFPRPSVFISDAKLNFPSLLSGRAESIRIYLKILPLLSGEGVVSRVRVNGPDVTVTLPENQNKEETGVGQKQAGDIDSDHAVLAAYLHSAVNRWILQIRDGALTVKKNRKDLLTLRRVSGKFDITPAGLEMSIKGDAGLWGRFSAGGKVIAEKDAVTLREFSISSENGSITGLSARYRQGPAPYLDAMAGNGAVEMNALFKYRFLFDDKGNSFERLKGIKGLVRFSEMRVSGPLRNRDKWQMKLTGEIVRISADLTQLPNPILISRGRFAISMNDAAFDQIQASVLDSSLSDLSFHIFWRSAPSVENVESVLLSLKGTIGTDAIQRLSKTFGIASDWTIRHPVTVSETKLKWENGSGWTLTGKGIVQTGLSFTVDLYRGDKEWFMRELFLEDPDSRANFSIRQIHNDLELDFAGNLKSATLAKIFGQRKFYFNLIRGDLKARIPLDHPEEIRIRGNAEGSDLILPDFLDRAVKGDRVSFRADGRTFVLSAGRFSWGDFRFYLSGEIKATPEDFQVDLDAGSERVDFETILQLLNRNGKNAENRSDETGSASYKRPVKGVIRFSSPALIYKQFTVRPYKAKFILRRSAVTKVIVDEAVLCGLSMPGVLNVNQDEYDLDFRPNAHNEPIEPVFACLTGSGLKMTGLLDLKSEIRAHGKVEELLPSMEGNISFRASEGKIFQYALLARIFSLLNITELLRGQLPDFQANGLEFKAISIKGEMRNGKLELKEGSLNGPTVNMAGRGEIDLYRKKMKVNLLVAPFRTINDIISHIPIVNRIAGRTLISIPVQISGNLDDPNIIPLAPSAVGEEIKGIMKGTLTLPFKIVEPIVSNQK